MCWNVKQVLSWFNVLVNYIENNHLYEHADKLRLILFYGTKGNNETGHITSNYSENIQGKNWSCVTPKNQNCYSLVVSATGQLTKTQLRRSPGARVVFKPGARQNFSGQVSNLRDSTAWPQFPNETHPSVEILQRHSKRWEHVVYNAMELKPSHRLSALFLI